jgi:lysozyme family protein
MPTFEEWERGYYNLWNRAKIRPEKREAARSVAATVLRNRARYERIAVATGVPWYWIGLTHNLEGGGRFDTYLGNGQRLNAVTTIVPKGRGPFRTFEDGAIDALSLKRIVNLPEGTWTFAFCLYQAERYNGFGYVSRKINSPYLWSFTDLYTKGKYVKDGVFSATAVSSQVGFAAALKMLIEISGDANMKLQDTVAEASILAPTLLRLLAGAGERLAVRALADALDMTDSKADADTVNKTLEALPLAAFKTAIRAAEEAVAELVGQVGGDALQDPSGASPAAVELAPTPAPTPAATEVPAAPVTFLDRVIPAGLKTPLGILIYVAGSVLVSLGYITPEIGQAISTVGGGLAGVGLIAKLDRWLPLIQAFARKR